MSSSGIWANLASIQSVQNTYLDQLATAGQISLFGKGFRSVRNFAIEYRRSQFAAQSLHGTAAQEISFNLEGVLLGDFINKCHLEIKLPPLQDTADTDLASWVWAVGYAMIESVALNIEGQEVERLSGDYCELYDELHRKPGQAIRETIFKYDNVTVPELAALSKQAHTLYIPIPFFFTHGPACVLPIGKNFDKIVKRHVKVEVQLNLRSIADFAIALPNDDDATTIGIPKCANTGQSLEWGDIKIQLYVQQVFLEDDEANSMWQGYGYRAMASTVQSLNTIGQPYPTFDANGVFDRKKLPLKFPTKNIIFAIADRERLGRNIANHVEPFSNNTGVSRIFGERSSHKLSNDTYATDWNSRGTGQKTLDTLDTGTINHAYHTSNDVREWRSDGQCGSIFLPCNRFDYRSFDTTDGEVEPVNSISLKLNGQERINQLLHPSYLRTVQSLHFKNQPRKGIYCYSFALDSSSPLPTGSINLSRVNNRDLRITINGTSTDSRELALYSEHLNIFEIGEHTSGAFKYQA
jgi:hypothetical protein